MRRLVFLAGLLLLLGELGAGLVGVRQALHLRQVALALQQNLRAAAQPLTSASLSKLTGSTLADSRRRLDVAAQEAQLLLAAAHWGSRGLWLARQQPQADEEMRQTLAALTAARDGSQMAIGLLDVIQGLGVTPDGALQEGTLLRTLESAQPRLAASLLLSADVSRELAQVHGGRLARGLQPSLGPMESGLPLVQRGLQLAILAPAALGADGPVSYLVVAQNPQDLRPTGGFMGSWGILTVRDGHIVNLDYRAYNAWEDVRDPKRAWPVQTAPVQRYMHYCCMDMQDANWYPDFPTTALVLEQFAQADQSLPIAGVIAFDPVLVQTLLRVTGPVELSSLHVTATADNLIELANAYEGRGTVNPSPEELATKQFLVDVAQALAKRLTQSQPLPWSALAAAMPALLQQKHVLLAVNDPEMAAWLHAMSWDGAVTTPEGDYLLLDEMSMSDNKVDQGVTRSIDDTVHLTSMGGADVTLQLTWHNGYPFAVAHGAGKGAGIPSTTAFRDYFRLYLPAGSVAGGPVGVDDAWPVSSEAGHTVVSGFVVIPQAGSRQVTVRYHVPAAVVAGSTGPAYALHVQVQPGTPPPAFHVRLLAPDGHVLADQAAALNQDRFWAIAAPGVTIAAPPPTLAWDRSCAGTRLVAGLKGPASPGRVDVPAICAPAAEGS